MDSNAQLALMTKAKLVFEDSPDAFLSFPALLPTSYTPDQLDLPGIPDSSQQSQILQEFSQLVNAIPQGVLFDATGSDVLWNIYGNVLGVFPGAGAAVQLAQGALSAQQDSELQLAQAYLYTQTADGQRTASPAYQAYSQCQSAYLQATQNYKTKQISALASTDPAAQAQWQNTDEPALRALVQTAMDNWNNQGNKAAVEQALQTVATASTWQSPQVTWESWKDAFQPALDILTDPNTNANYALTAFSPSNAATQTNWPTFTLSSAEILQLVSQAPKELANIFGTATGTSTVAALSFEFCSVVLNRPWFKPDLFGARFWRFADGSLPLSDGGTPATGTLSAYVKGLIFVRNIVVTPVAAAGASGPIPIKTLPAVNQIVDVHPFLLRPVPPLNLHPVPGATLPVRPAAPAVQAVPIQARPMVMMAPAIAPAHQNPSPPPAATAPQVIPTLWMRPPLGAQIHAATFAAAPASTPPAPPSTTNVPPANAGTISILAFICQRVPQCPNPDPNLTW